MLEQLRENRIYEVSQGTHKIKLAEEIMRKEHRTSVGVMMTDGRDIREELIIDAKVLKAAKGYVFGAFVELKNEREP